MDRLTYQHYEIARRPEDGTPWELGRGAMGVTYKALDTNLHAPVALKVIAGELLPDARARARFLREARAAAQLRHNHVAAVYHLGQEAEGVFYTMEFIEGETLDALVRRDGPLPTVMALRVAEQTARALQAAHARGLLHRDLKPSNLMVRREVDGEWLVKVIDFGLVKPLEPDEGEETAAVHASLSRGLFLGTPLYASPEQCAQDEKIDGRADLYSLGATLWFLLAGEPPFRGTTRTVMAQHLAKPPPLERLAGQPPAVRDLLAALLAKEPADRPADAGVLRQRLAEILRGIETGTGAGAAAVSTLTPTPPPLPPSPPEVSEKSFTLAEVLATRGGQRLSATEIGALLFPLATLLDGEAAANRRLPVRPAGVRVRVPTGVAWRELPPTGWDAFGLEVNVADAEDKDAAAHVGDAVRALAAIVGALLAGEGAPAAVAILREVAAGEEHFPSAAALAIALLASLVRAGGSAAGGGDGGGVPVAQGPVPSLTPRAVEKGEGAMWRRVFRRLGGR